MLALYIPESAYSISCRCGVGKVYISLNQCKFLTFIANEKSMFYYFYADGKITCWCIFQQVSLNYASMKILITNVAICELM